jgi:hypothetical protein
MANKLISFTDKEDEIIMQCFKDNPKSHVSDVIKKASTLTSRSFSTIYGRYYDKYRHELKSLNKLNP